MRGLPEPARRAVALLLTSLAAPLVVAAGLGWANAPSAFLQAAFLAALRQGADLLDLSLPSALPGIVLLVGLGAAGVAGLAEHAPASLRGLLRAGEALIAVAGLLSGGLGLALAAGLDRPLFFAGLLALLLPAGWRRPSLWRRPLLAAAAAGVAVLAARAVLEGTGQHHPVFALRDLWLGGPGRSPFASGGVWLLLGLGIAAGAHRAGVRAPPWGAGLLVASVVGLEIATAPAPHRAWADALSAVGLLAAATGLPLLRERLREPPAPSWTLDPAAFFACAAPLLVWGALCAARGLTVAMWTVPPVLPEGVTRISSNANVFALAVAEDGAVWFTDREAGAVGRLDPAGGERLFPVPGGGEAPEEIAILGGSVWISIAGQAGGALVPVDPQTGLGKPFPVPACWIAVLTVIASPEQLDLPVGAALIGCESSPVLWVFDSVGRRLLVALPMGSEVEDAVLVPVPPNAAPASRDMPAGGARVATVPLWNGDRLALTTFPEGAPVARRRVGPFSWGVALDPLRQTLWVPRFFEGQALLFDAATLRPAGRARLPFGVRALKYDPAHDAVWVSAAYAGELVRLDAGRRSPPRRFAVCGQGRALALTPSGDVLVSSDCGVLRVAAEARP